MSRRERTGRLRFGPFEADPSVGELYKHGIKLKLHQQPFKVLIVLLEHRNEVVTREQLRATLWPGDTFVAFDKGLDTAIHRLRNVLADSRDNPRFIETLPRRGYRFIGSAEEVFREVPDEGIPAENPRRHSLAWAYVALVGLTIAAAISINSFRKHDARGAKRVSSLAVLPLRNVSGDPTQEYLVDGMTEELATDLRKIPGLLVISQTSASRYKGTRKTPQDIAKELKVDALVDGALLRSGGRVRITIHLVEASTGRQLWAREYDRKLEEVVALQNDVTRSVAQRVGITLSPDDESRLAKREPINPGAYEAYLNGRQEASQWTKAGLSKSVEYFKEALQKDPIYAPAWAGLSDAYSLSVLFRFLPHDDALAQSKEAALKALELDDTLSEAHVALASASLSEWSWSAAENEIRRAIELDPNNATAHQWYGYLLRAQGRHENAIAEMKIALQLDPLTSNKKQSLGATLYVAGHYDEALQQFQEMPEGDANMQRRHRLMAQIYERKGMPREAIAEFLKLMRLQGKAELAASIEQQYLAAGYPQAKKHLLLAELEEIQVLAQHPGSPPRLVDAAGDYALLGVDDKAFEFLEKAFKQHDETVMYLKVDDRFLKLHADPRFRNLMHRIGLPL